MRRLARHARFNTDDVGEFRDSVRRLLDREINLVISDGRNAGRFHLDVHTAKLSLLTVCAVEVTDGLSIFQTHMDYSLARVQSGVIERWDEGVDHIFTPGAGYLSAPQQEANMVLPKSGGSVSSLAITLPAALVERQARLLIGEPVRRTLEIIGPLDLRPSTRLGQRIECLLDQLASDDGLFEKYPLHGEEVQRELIAALIEQTPNNYLPLLRQNYGGPARRHISIMEEYIEANLLKPITIAELAAAVGIGARTLRENCHRMRGLTPERIVRKMRLYGAHRRLETPQPQDTITSIRHEYGFTNAKRFKDLYRKEFRGESPAETFQRGIKRLKLLLASRIEE